MNRRIEKIGLGILLCIIIAALIPATSAGQQNRKSSKVCSVCKGKKVCAACNGTGLSGQVLSLPWGTQYIPCMLCGGKRICMSCDGTGRRDVELAKLQSHSSNNSGYSNNNNRKRRNSGNHSSRQCSYCGGTGLQASVAYENDPSGASIAISYGIVGYVNTEGTRCHRCGRYTYHLHYKCPDCNNR